MNATQTRILKATTRFYLVQHCGEALLASYEKALEAYEISGQSARAWEILEEATTPILESVLPETLETYELLVRGVFS